MEESSRHRIYPSHWNTDLYQCPTALYKQDLFLQFCLSSLMFQHQMSFFFLPFSKRCNTQQQTIPTSLCFWVDIHFFFWRCHGTHSYFPPPGLFGTSGPRDVPTKSKETLFFELDSTAYKRFKNTEIVSFFFIIISPKCFQNGNPGL